MSTPETYDDAPWAGLDLSLAEVTGECPHGAPIYRVDLVAFTDDGATNTPRAARYLDCDTCREDGTNRC